MSTEVRAVEVELPAADPDAAAAGQRIRGEALVPARAAGAVAQGVILCHGFKGFGRWGFFPYLAERLAAEGLTAVTFDFSGSGVGPDRETFTELEAFAHNGYRRELADLAAVEREALARGWVRRGYGLFGHSRGGGVAVLHAGRVPAPGEPVEVGALVTWAAIAGVARWSPEDVAGWRARGYIDVPNTRTGQLLRLDVGALDEIERLRHTVLDVAAAAARVRAPWLIVHGTADETVSVDDGRRLHAAAPAVSELLLLDGVSHAFDARHPMGAPPPVVDHAVRSTAEFFLRHLGAR